MRRICGKYTSVGDYLNVFDVLICIFVFVLPLSTHMFKARKCRWTVFQRFSTLKLEQIKHTDLSKVCQGI